MTHFQKPDRDRANAAEITGLAVRVVGFLFVVSALFSLFAPELLFGESDSQLLSNLCGALLAGLGVGLIFGSAKPVTNWAIVLVGFLTSSLAFFALGVTAFGTQANSQLIVFCFAAFAISIVLLVALYQISKLRSDPFYVEQQEMTLNEAISQVVSHRGVSLRALSEETPVLVVFLRHVGCPFCRDMLATMSTCRDEIEQQDCSIALVHMSQPLRATQALTNFGLDDIHRFCDPNCSIYRAFSLGRGGLIELLGPRVWWRGIQSAIFKGRGFGAIEGDSFQMPGVFMIHRGEVVASHRAQHSADNPNLLEFVENCISGEGESDRQESAVAIQA